MNNYSTASLLNKREVKKIFSIFESESKELRLVGGCIRDAILKKETRDIDIAANVQPDEILRILKKNQIRYEDFAYKYGSITAIVNDNKFQITALREDINQVGRHTNIIFTDDWKKDARRRDFTFNAIYLSSDGTINDYFNGQKDIKEKKIKFIGNIEQRIQEDYLRIFRYYRFLGIFNMPIIIEDYEEIFKKHYLEAYNFLSNDILRQEILKMFNMPFSINCFFKDFKTREKRQWLTLTKERFIKTEYQLGLNKCLNKIDLLIN